MKKALFTVPLLFLCCWFCGYAQTPDWVWAKNGQGFSEGFSIAANNSSDVFIAGQYINTITFGSYVLTSTGTNGFLAKYDSNGNVKWAKGTTGGVTAASRVTTDNFGNTYVTGNFLNTVSFGSFSLTSVGNYDVFLAKYDSMGNEVWVRRAGGSGPDYGQGIITDATGNIFLTGRFSSIPFSIGSFNLPNAGVEDIFLAKYDSAGNVLWARRAGGTVSDGAYSIAIDASANLYVTGYFDSPTMIIGADTLIDAGSLDLFIAKYDSSGNALWAQSAGGTGLEYGFYVVTDASNNVYLTGSYSSSSITFGSYMLSNAGADDAFLVKYNPSGNVLWAKKISGTANEMGFCISTGNLDKIYTTGSFTSATLTIDTLTFQRPAVFNDPMYVAGFDSSGHAFFGKVLASGGDDWNAVAATPSGCLYVGGDFLLSPFIVGNDTLTHLNTNTENEFIAKLCNTGIMASFTSSSSIFCAEPTHCINFFDQSIGNPTSWHWHFTGANPDTSSLQNPDSICYSSPGTYPVQLIVSNGTTTDTLTVASMIIVGGTPVQPTISIVGGDTLISSHGSAYQWYLNGNIIAGATDSFYIAHQGGTYSVQITDQYGCQSQSAGMQVGIDELSGGGGIAVFPNPFNNELIASPRSAFGGRGEFEFTLFDVTSRVLLHRLFTNQATINTEHLARGMYFYEVRDKNGAREMGKVVKE